MIAWIVSILFLPYIAVPFYFLIGIRKRDSIHKKVSLAFDGQANYTPYLLNEHEQITTLDTIFGNNGIPPATKGHTLTLIPDSTQAYREILREIEQAQHSIDICTYVFVFDATTHKLLDALIQKAQIGVRVRLLLDLVGSLGVYMNQKALHALRDAGGEVAFFTSLLRRPYLNYISLRNHRKVFIFDQQTVLSGGMNLSNEYLGERSDHKRYRDLLFKLKGPCVSYFYHIFYSDWIYAVKKEEKRILIPQKQYDGNDIVQVVPSGPDIPTDALYEAILNAIYLAKERIWIVTPYFVPDENIMQALIIAYRKGVDVKLITPKNSDHFFVDIVRMSYIRELYEIGVDVLLFENGILHAKAMIIDEMVGMTGSVNLDNRSLFFNYEIATFIYSKQQITNMSQWIEALIESSSRDIAKPGKTREAFENIMKVFAPIL